MNILKKTIVSLLLLIFITPESSIFAWTLTESVNSIQATDSTLPTGVSNPKGSIGALLAELFWGMGDGVKNGKIKPQYIDYSGISAWTQSGSDVFTSGTGNVGIGVNNPSAKLEVAGQIKITGGSPGNGKVLVSDTSGLASWSASAPLYSFSETDPVWNGVSGNYYTKTNLQTSGQSSVHWGNLTNAVVANGFAPGILSVADWNTFNGKQNALGYTPAKTDGTNATGTWGIGISGNAATATTASSSNFINAADGDRNAATKLPTTSGHGVRFDFVSASSAGGGGNYSGLMTYAPWAGTSASTGDASYQLSFNSPGTNASGVPYLGIRNGIDGTWNTWYTLLNSGNYNSYSPTLTGIGASGTWGIGISGNAATATNLSTNRSTWNTNGTISAVVGQLSWKNYGNGHTIFDASKSTSPDGTAVNSSNAAIAWTPTYPTLMGWNGTSTYGVRVDSARVSDSVAWAGISGAPSFATNAVSGRVRAYEVGCESGWGSSCDANTNGRIDNSDNSTTVGGLGIGSLRQFNTWQNSHYSGTDGAEYATIFYDTDNSGYYINPNGTSNISGLVVGGGISDSAGARIDAGGGWMRTYGDTGWYNGTYAGGWYMTDATWIRAYNSKSVYSPGEVQATTVRGNSNLCIGGDCRAAWPAAGGISTTTTVNCSQSGYSGGGSYDASCTATCAAGWYRTGCVIQAGYSTSVSTNGCSFRASNQTVQGTAICAK